MNGLLANHPCFNEKVRCKTGRVHLPVAPACNIQCRFCNRKFDCVNESRPGVCSAVLSPGQAMAYLERLFKHDNRIAVVGIAGPGDPLANSAATLETLRRVRQKYPEMLLCLATNGLNLPEHADALADIGVGHVTVTVNAVDPTIGAKVYAWVRDGKRMLRGEEGAQRLMERQMEGIVRLKQRGVTVKVNTIIVPGVNDHHVGEVARTVSELGADIMNAIPIYPVADSEWADKPEPSAEMVARVRKEAEAVLPQMTHCTRCRADAAGLLGESNATCGDLLAQAAGLPLEPADRRPYVAVGSMEGVLVNQHLGETTHLWIFEQRDDGTFRHVDTRETPPPGGGERWEKLSRTLKDCRAVMVSGAGQSPRTALNDAGIELHITEGMIDSVLGDYFAGRTLPVMAREGARCGSDCVGNGTGCM